MNYAHAIDTGADVAPVWQAVIDVETWPRWTASMNSVKLLDNGPLRVGTRARIKQPKMPTTVWQVSELTDQEEFTWVSKSPGVRTTGRHRVSRNADGSTRITLGIEQTGLLAPVIGALVGRRTRRFLEMEAAGLKAAGEAIAAQ